LTVAFLPDSTGIDLRITSWGDLPPAEARAALDAIEVRMRERLGRHVYGSGNDDLAAVVGRCLEAGGWSVAVAESCTGGLLAKRLTDAAGASAYVAGGVVAYSNALKTTLLGVDPALIERVGAVSEEVASAMLDGAHRLTGAHAALSITGIAGPGGGTPEKPVGTVWIGASLGERRIVRSYVLPGTRAEVRTRSAQTALARLLDLLRDADT
jgi:nicotinamide-nucleotide amidase